MLSFVTLTLLGLTGMPRLSADGTPRRPTGDAKSGSPVILELFTSEGCSSCPPADELLAKLENQQPVANVQVIALEEHVDYWNNDGWVDPFSGIEWTTRQQNYAFTLGNHNPYTPQLVINGHTQFPGGRTEEAFKAITAAAPEVTTEVSVTPGPSDKHGPELDISVGKLGKNARDGDVAEVWLAVTESGLHSSVSSGENAGKELQHASVVREMHKIGIAEQNKDVSFSRELPVSLNSKWKPENLRVVVFVQEKKSRQIIGAAEARLK
jgi:hypothetical protein